MKRILHLLTLWDKVLVVLLLAGSIVSFSVLFLTSHEGTAVIISSPDGELRKSLNTDQEFSVAGPLGETRVVIQNRHAWIDSSPCPNQLCIHMGKIHRVGEMVVCVPNRVSVRVAGREKHGLDATTM